jgi:hypothetical protein
MSLSQKLACLTEGVQSSTVTVTAIMALGVTVTGSYGDGVDGARTGIILV